MGANFKGRGVAHQPLLVSESWSDCPFVWYQNIRSASFGFITIHASDRQTEGQNLYTTPKTALAYACAVIKNQDVCILDLLLIGDD